MLRHTIGASVLLFCVREEEMRREQSGLDAQLLQNTADRWQHAADLAARYQPYVDVLCATVAFGMGIDKNNVRYIIHYDLPTSFEGCALSDPSEVRLGRHVKHRTATTKRLDAPEETVNLRDACSFTREKTA